MDYKVEKVGKRKMTCIQCGKEINSFVVMDVKYSPSIPVKYHLSCLNKIVKDKLNHYLKLNNLLDDNSDKIAMEFI